MKEQWSKETNKLRT